MLPSLAFRHTKATVSFYYSSNLGDGNYRQTKIEIVVLAGVVVANALVLEIFWFKNVLLSLQPQGNDELNTLALG